MPQALAGLRSEPPRSLPKPIGLIPVVSATASLPLEPPAVRCAFQGLRVMPYNELSVLTRSPMSGRLVRPMGIAPAARMRCTTSASSGTTAPASGRNPPSCGQARHVDVFLDREGHSVQRPQGLAPDYRLIGQRGARSRFSSEHAHDGADLGVDCLDAPQMRLHNLSGGGFPACDHPRQFASRSLPQLHRHRISRSGC